MTGGFNSLNFLDICKYVDSHIENNLVPHGLLSFKDQKRYLEAYSKSTFAYKYLNNLKIDSKVTENKFYQRLLYILNKCPNNIDYDTVN